MYGKSRIIFHKKKIGLSEIKKIIPAVFTNTDIRGVTLAGGEPMLNEEIFNITSFLSSLNIRVSITSNGILLTEENVKRLISCGMAHFEISMPATEPEIFNKLCRSYNIKAVRAAMLNIKEQGAKLSVASMICKMNYKSITEIVEMSSAFGADYFVFNRFVPGGKGKYFADELKLNQSELFHALSMANHAVVVNKIPIIVAIPVEHCILDTSSFKNLHFGTCGCGRAKWIVDPEGNLRCCEQNPLKLGNLLTEDFKTLSQKADVKMFRDDNLSEYCTKKDCYKICGGGCRYCR
ncbi:MAG: radical SAM protein [Bacteroidota bacterium]